MSAFAYGIRAKGGEYLSIDEMRAKVPSIFATHAHHSRSEKYVPISSVAVMEALIKEGFMPVEALGARCKWTNFGFNKHAVRFRKLGDQTERHVGDTHFEVILFPKMRPHAPSSSIHKENRGYPSLRSVDLPMIDFIDYVPMRFVPENIGIEIWQKTHYGGINLRFLQLREVRLKNCGFPSFDIHFGYFFLLPRPDFPCV